MNSIVFKDFELNGVKNGMPVELHLKKIAFIYGADSDPTFLRGQIFDNIKRAIRPQYQWTDISDAEWNPSLLRVSLFANVPAEVLLMFDLADRSQFAQRSSTGSPLVRNFRKILVPGRWLARELLQNEKLGLTDEDVQIVGSPRVDFLRKLASEKPASVGSRIKVLFAPLHGNWFGRNGEPMTCEQELLPQLDSLRANFDICVVPDGRNKADKRPITDELLEADIVITDYTSLCYEAWALGKPVVFPSWLTSERLLEKAPQSAEAHIYRNRIGHHADSFDDLFRILCRGHSLDLGVGVDAFMDDYLANYKNGDSARTIAKILEGLADPQREHLDREARTQADLALTSKDWRSAERALAELIIWNVDDSSLYDKLARSLNGQGNWSQEVLALESALSLKPRNAALLHRLGMALQRCGKFRAAASAFSEAIQIAPKKATTERYYQLGYAIEMSRIDGHFDARGASQAYAAACAKDPTGRLARYGVGALHAAAGRSQEAKAAYRSKLLTRPFDAELLQRLGMACDRCYEWVEAENYYRTALAFDSSKAAWHYRLGFVLERQEKYEAAATAYLQAIQLSKKHQGSWYYRAGYVLEKANRHQAACDAYAKVIAAGSIAPSKDPYAVALEHERLTATRRQLHLVPDDTELWIGLSNQLESLGNLQEALDATTEAIVRSKQINAKYSKRHAALTAKLQERSFIEARLHFDCTRPADWLRYSEILTDAGDLEEAVRALNQAVMRSDKHMPTWHQKLGMLLVRLGRLTEACEEFRNQQILQRPHGVYEDKFEESAELRETATYREFFDVLPIRSKTIFYESFGGEGCSDNPYAIFLHVQKDTRFAGWQHVWSIDDTAKIPADLRNRQDVFFVKKETTLYQRYLCTAEYLVNNGTFPSYYVRKNGQRYLNTWHGTPLKTLGYDINATPLQRANTARNLIQASLFIAPNRHTERIMIERYGVKNLFTGRSLLTGYPRIDLLLNATDTERNQIRTRLKIDPTKPVVLFAPTYRGHWATPELEADDLIATIEKMKSPNYNLLFRGHYFAEKAIATMDLPVTIAPHAIDTCSLLSIVDVLVTDYSSIFYDFLVTGKPLIHYVPDWDYYSETRGMYFGKDELPGIICETVDQLLLGLENCIAAPDKQITRLYQENREKYCYLEDGHSSERVIQALFFDPDDEGLEVGVGSAKHLLIHGGDLATGIRTEAVRSFLTATQDAGYRNTLVVDRKAIIDSPERTANAQELLECADVAIRFGRACFSLEEAWINDKIKMPYYEPSQEMRKIFDNSMKHEVRRLFGDTRFDLVIEFAGDRAFWANLMAAVPADQHFLCLHEDLTFGSSRRYSGVERVVDAGIHSDSFIAPSIPLGDKSLSVLANIVDRKLIDFPPFINEQSIAVRAQELSADAVFNQYASGEYLRIVLMSGGSISESIWLLDAVEIILQSRPDSIFYFVMPDIIRIFVMREILIRGLQDKVLVSDKVVNTIPYINSSACVVFGQSFPFSANLLLEAMVLGKPCVVCDTRLTAYLPTLHGASLVEKRPEELAETVLKVNNDSRKRKEVNIDLLNKRALKSLDLANRKG